MSYVPRQPDPEVNRTQTSPLMEAGKAFVGLVAIMVVAYIGLGFAVDWVAPHIDAKTERSLGALFKDQFSRSLDEYQPLLDTLVTEIEGLPPLEYTLFLIKDPTPNALAFPGGAIGIHTGLLESVDSENELTFILGHELGHFQHHDHLRQLGRGLVFAFLSQAVLGQTSGGSTLASMTSSTLERHHSRQQELDADQTALALMQKHYGHVGASDAFFKRLLESGHANFWQSYYSTHPHPQDRIRALEASDAQKGWQTSGKLTPFSWQSESDE